jgi:hypothetical protein
MSNPKRLRTGRLQLSCLPSDLMQMVVAFAAPTLADPNRTRLVARAIGEALSRPSRGGAPGFASAAAVPVPRHVVAVSAAFSGALVLGGADIAAYRLLGLRW